MLRGVLFQLYIPLEMLDTMLGVTQEEWTTRCTQCTKCIHIIYEQEMVLSKCLSCSVLRPCSLVLSFPDSMTLIQRANSILSVLLCLASCVQLFYNMAQFCIISGFRVCDSSLTYCGIFFILLSQAVSWASHPSLRSLVFMGQIQFCCRFLENCFVEKKKTF